MDNLDSLVTNSSLTPKEIVSELDRYIIGQKDAKRAVAIALRNRERRMNVEAGLREEITPRNILMIGPTGVGKTEIARRLAKLADSPFAKVETTKFTEVGYVGRDVESIIKDLTDIAYNMTRAKFKRQVREQARNHAEERVLDALVGTDSSEETREKFREMLRAGMLDDKEIEIKISENNGNISNLDIPGMNSGHIGIINITDMVSKALGVSDKKKLKRLNVAESCNILIDEEEDKLLNEEKLIKETISMVESKGIVFLDEIDKIAAKHDRRGGDVSREGVQRDLLPLIEGCFVSTKYGMINTSHILFIASGAFHTSKPADLLPELQGRLPIRVELKSLTKEDMMAILIEPEASLIKQYIALIKTEKVELVFTDEAIQRIAEIATEVNNQVENIGARRLHTIMEKLLEDCSFNATEGLANSKFVVDKNYVELQLEALTKKIDLTKFIL